MKIIYIANIRLPTEKAHGIQIMKMCEAFAENGATVSLIVPARKNNIDGDAFSYYNVRNNFLLKYITVFDAIAFFRGLRLGFYVQAISFLWALRRERISDDSIIITRNPEIAWRYGQQGYQVFYDAHNFPSRGGWLLKRLLKNISGVIANSRGTADAFHNAVFKNILVAPNAVDLAQFDGAEARGRSALGLPLGRIAMYAGHLYEWKGVGVVIESARRSVDKELTFIFVGGTHKDIAIYRKRTHTLRNILFLGHHSRNDIPALIKSADVLLLPNIPSTQESISYTSPIKMFEYMASGVPIVASDLSSIKEVLNDKNAFLVKAGDPSELLLGIEAALNDEGLARAARAKEDVKEYTWEKRAKKVIEFIKRQ